VAVTLGATGSVSFVVSDDDTAQAIGSGDVPVLATPQLLAWFEAATVVALNGLLDAQSTSVGTRVDLEHLEPTGVGGRVTATASVVAIDGRLVRFDVAAVDADQRLVGHATITRVVVDRQRFMARIG
jgi:predicted thioesterase